MCFFWSSCFSAFSVSCEYFSLYFLFPSGFFGVFCFVLFCFVFCFGGHGRGVCLCLFLWWPHPGCSRPWLTTILSVDMKRPGLWCCDHSRVYQWTFREAKTWKPAFSLEDFQICGQCSWDGSFSGVGPTNFHLRVRKDVSPAPDPSSEWERFGSMAGSLQLTFGWGS